MCCGSARPSSVPSSLPVPPSPRLSRLGDPNLAMPNSVCKTHLAARRAARARTDRVEIVPRIAYLGPEGTFTEAALIRIAENGDGPR